MPQFRFDLKIRNLRFILGIFLLVWIVDFGREWKSFFPSSLLEAQNSSFWNLVAISSSQNFVGGTVILAGILSALFAIGILQTASGLTLSYLLICFFQINPMLYSPALPFQIWLLLALSLLGSPHAGSPEVKWLLYLGAWSLICIGYFISGLDKLLHSESWREGTSLYYILSGPLSRWPALFDAFEQLPVLGQKILSWSIPFFEMSFLPLALFQKTRPVAWWTLTGLHVIILAVLWLPSVSLGMLFFHFFLIDSGETSSRPKYRAFSKLPSN